MIWKQMDEPYWLITETGYLSLEKTIKQVNGYSADQLKTMSSMVFMDDEGEGDEDEGEFGAYSYMVSKQGPLAIVKVQGKLHHTESWFDQFLGIASYPAIMNAMQAASDHPEIEAIVLDVDSPGGSAKGADEAAEEIKRVDRDEKPVYAYVSGQMCSGAMWLGSAARDIGAARMSVAGSIGVLSVHMDISEMLKGMGIKTTVLTVGEHKAEGNPYEPLSKTAKENILSEMEQVFDVFAGTVSANRNIPMQEIIDQQAQVYMGKSARDHGLVDRILPMNRFLESVAAEVSGSDSFGPTGGHHSRKVTIMSKKKDASVQSEVDKSTTLTDRQKAALGAGASMDDVLADESLKEHLENELEGQENNKEVLDSGQEGGQETPPEVKEEGSATALSKAYDKLGDVMAEKAELKAELTALQASKGKQDAHIDQLKEVAIERIHQMQVATGVSPSELSDASVETVLAQHERTQKVFNERFKIGQTSVSRKDTNLHENGSEDDSTPNPAQLGAVRFGRHGGK